MEEIKAKNKPKTLEELFVNQFTELQESHGQIAKEWLKERQKTEDLQKIVETVKKHAKLDNGEVWIHISQYGDQTDRDFIVRELGLKEEEKADE